MSEQAIHTDFLVLGSGIAGLRAALGLARHGRVLVVTKDQPTESNTGYAQGGVAVALGADDDAGAAPARTRCAAGSRRSCARAAARVLVEEGPERIRELASWGARFDREEGRFHFTREGAHSRNRVLHALGDATGWEMVRAPAREGPAAPQAIEVRSFACSTDLVVGRRTRRGLPLPRRGRPRRRSCVARATLLATGGAGQVFAETTNPPVATGDGMWPWACAPGAALLDMEFVQFHPTALAVAGAPRFLVSEAVRGEGALPAATGRGALHGRAGARATRWRARSSARTRAGRGPGDASTCATSTPSACARRFPRIARHLPALRRRPHARPVSRSRPPRTT